MSDWSSVYSEVVAAISGSNTFFNSNFVTSLVGSLAGAFGGAWAAQRIAERAKQRDEIVREIRNLNAAMALAVSITNIFFGMKRQHVKKLYDEFQATRARVEQDIQHNQNSQQPSLIHFRADLETLPPVVTPIERLQDVLTDRVSTEPGPSMLLPVLSNSISSFNEAIVRRNELIERWKGKLSEPALVQVYFGFSEGQHVDQTYPSLIEAIHLYANDSIMFSKMIAELLNQQGKRVQIQFKARFRGPSPRLFSFDLSKGKDLIPPDDAYSDWQWVFKEEELRSKRWTAHLFEKFKSLRVRSRD